MVHLLMQGVFVEWDECEVQEEDASSKRLFKIRRLNVMSFE